MDAEQIIAEIEQLEEMFEAPDIRPLSASDISAANRNARQQPVVSDLAGLWGLLSLVSVSVLRLGERKS